MVGRIGCVGGTIGVLFRKPDVEREPTGERGGR
jgi:hypothetical protein